MIVTTDKATIVKTIEIRIKLEGQEEIEDLKAALTLLEAYFSPNRGPSFSNTAYKFITEIKKQLTP